MVFLGGTYGKDIDERAYSSALVYLAANKWHENTGGMWQQCNDFKWLAVNVEDGVRNGWNSLPFAFVLLNYRSYHPSFLFSVFELHGLILYLGRGRNAFYWSTQKILSFVHRLFYHSLPTPSMALCSLLFFILFIIPYNFPIIPASLLLSPDHSEPFSLLFKELLHVTKHFCEERGVRLPSGFRCLSVFFFYSTSSFVLEPFSRTTTKLWP